MAEQLDKLKRMAKVADINVDALIKELSDSIENKLAAKLQDALEGIEIKLGQKIEQTGKGMGQNISALVDTAVTAKLPDVVKQVGGEFISRAQVGGDTGGVDFFNLVELDNLEDYDASGLRLVAYCAPALGSTKAISRIHSWHVASGIA